MNNTNIVMIIMCSHGKKRTMHSHSGQKGLSQDIFCVENSVVC